jgi:hypothetical protein
MDYFCLRQCVNDFSVARIIPLVAAIGTLLADIDDHLDYLRRSFCALELFAAVQGGVPILVQTNYSKSQMEELLTKHPVNAVGAATHWQHEKELVDNYIKQNIGFENFDRKVTNAAIHGANPYKGGRF